MDTLQWGDIEPTADRIFSVWTGQPELHWAKAAWGHLAHAGLTEYDIADTNVEEVKVYVRLVALGMIYHDWCCAAYEECVDPILTFWLEDLPTDDWEFHLGRLVGKMALAIDEKVSIEDGVRLLAHEERQKVVKALLDGFGGESGLFIALWRSAQDPDRVVSSLSELKDEDDDRDVETDEMVVNDVTPLKLRAFEWISEGCYPYQ